MKFLRRLFSVSLVFVILFATFSITVNAESTDIGGAEVYFFYDYEDPKTSYYNEFYFDSVISSADTWYCKQLNNEAYMEFVWRVEPYDSNGNTMVVVPSGRRANLVLDNLHLLYQFNGQWHYIEKLQDVEFNVQYQDGTEESIHGGTFISMQPNGQFRLDFTAKKNVIGFTVYAKYFFEHSYNYGAGNLLFEYAYGTNYTPDVRFEVFSEDYGIAEDTNKEVKKGFAGIIQWLKDLFDNIKNGFSNIGGWFTDLGESIGGFFSELGEDIGDWFSDLKLAFLGAIWDFSTSVSTGFSNIVGWFSDLWDSIVALPGQIWDKIYTGLQDLFVPDDEFLEENSQLWNYTLSVRLGAVYQVGQKIIDAAEQIQYSDTTDTIYLPATSLDSVGIPFTFGGYEIKVVPDGFGVIVTALKTIISIICTLTFVNGLRHRYEEIMEVEK